MFRFTQKPSSGSHIQCLAKITYLVPRCALLTTCTLVPDYYYYYYYYFFLCLFTTCSITKQYYMFKCSFDSLAVLL